MEKTRNYHMGRKCNDDDDNDRHYLSLYFNEELGKKNHINGGRRKIRVYKKESKIPIQLELCSLFNLQIAVCAITHLFLHLFKNILLYFMSKFNRTFILIVF